MNKTKLYYIYIIYYIILLYNHDQNLVCDSSVELSRLNQNRMSQEMKSSDADVMDVEIANQSDAIDMEVDVEVLDEYQTAVDLLDEQETSLSLSSYLTSSLSPSLIISINELILKYLELMKNVRFDEVALRVKESVICK